jgi:hypothetical protein
VVQLGAGGVVVGQQEKGVDVVPVKCGALLVVLRDEGLGATSLRQEEEVRVRG